jgi:hypothetical protein
VTFILAIVLALHSLFTRARASNASLSTFSPAPSAPDLRGELSSELRILESYHDDFVSYNKLCSPLGRRAALRQAELEPAKRKASDLSGRLTGVQNAIREVIRKFKAANAWNDLDASLSAKPA